ncbi:hypothetical protein NSK_007815 [Nannochloropsis salina CCMP1776]|uniref:BAR domain-containing protein n=1 Tax=Nannochloropsis salina CCMP1776 TaxID=1027361 RepID=A0A4D9CP02_9STRA|nr:hypothetical protein NSK_007815 [Nannochloropsis salina CCMP1776]|eukprot:TFJ80860.1 hypothetical protein NSK_007815 [Nannochloropsis salina CCMP1776]
MYKEEWASTKAKGGDEVRRRLGIVGTKSPLFRIDKAIKAVQNALLEGDLGEDVGDVLDFVDASQRVLDGIKNADFLAYSNNFASFGNGGGALDFMEQSHEAMTPALEAFEDIMDILRLPK